MVISTRDVNNGEIQKKLADAWLNIQVDENKLFNPLDWPPEYEENPEKYIAWVLTRPEYFSFICSEILNVQLIPTQALMLKEMWNRRFPMLIASRGFGKSFMLSVYAMLRILLMNKRKVMLAGAVFRQSKVIFEYMENIYYNAPLLRDIIGKGQRPIRHDTDLYRFTIGDSTCTAIPIGDGSKIRGQRANDLITDEFASIPQAIFENVLAGFAAVKAHPIEHVKHYAAEALAKELGIWEPPAPNEERVMKDNQIIVSGTAYYDFNHFGKYWKDWHEIICSQGNPKVLAEYFRKKAQDDQRDDIEVPEGFNWKDYSIIRIPFEMIPPGFMDAAQVARSRATIHAGIYLMEFGACFSTDSNGFFSRKLIESCIADRNNPIIHQSGPVFFEANIYGNPQCKYVYGIDPASEIDNFSIVVLELWPDHRRIVYGWTTNREQHKQEIKDHLVQELDYYSYCAKKIRWLMNRFPCERIMMDSQGGGIPVMEALHDPDKIKEGEQPIWPVIDEEKPQMSDGNVGLHIVELVNFASAAWTEEANHGMRKDLEDKILLFPYFDAITVANAAGDDKIKGTIYDTLEDCVMDIEELKDELSMIIITQTATGRDKWDTPEVKMPGGKKGRLRKDRYSALVMANMGARQLMRTPPPLNYESHGGFAQPLKASDGGMYVGSEKYNQWAQDFYKYL